MGFDIEGDITKIYNNYINKHHECSVLSPDAVYLRMKEEGVITQEQYDRIKNGLIFDFKSKIYDNWKSTFGLQIAQSKKTNSVKQNNAKQKTFHPVYKDLQLDSKGEIDMNQFLVETIKQKYSKGEYIIDYKKSDNEFSYTKSSIKIKDKTGRKILSLTYNSDGSISQTSYKNGKEFNFYCIENGIVTSGRHTETDGRYVQYNYEKDGKTIKEYITWNKDIDTVRTYNDGELKEINIKNAKTNKTEIKKYKHGVLVSTIIYNNIEREEYNHILSKMNNIYSTDKYGHKHIHAGNAQDLVKVLDKDNIIHFLYEYKKKYNKDFLLYFNSHGPDSTKQDKEKLLIHIQNCLLKANKYEPYKKITNDRISNDNYTSKNVYDVQYSDNIVIINNKTTGKQSKLWLNRLLARIKDPVEKAVHKINIQKLPAEILEFYANEGISLRANKELDAHNSVEVKNGRMKSGGFYTPKEETITLPFYTSKSTYIHEVFHALNYDKFNNAISDTKELKNAFELGLKRYEAAGYGRYYVETIKNTNNKNERYYFSTNADECWARVGEMLYYGECKGQEILKQFWPEFIELEKQKIAEIQNKPTDKRHS